MVEPPDGCTLPFDAHPADGRTRRSNRSSCLVGCRLHLSITQSPMAP